MLHMTAQSVNRDHERAAISLTSLILVLIT
jgi:hypothetical protein